MNYIQNIAIEYIDCYVEVRTTDETTDREIFDQKDLLKLYIYRYFCGIRFF